MKVLKLIAGFSIPRVAILAVLMSIIYYISYFDDGSGLQTQISEMSNQVDFETTRRAEVNKTIKKEEEMRGNLLQLQRNLEVVKSKIPNEFKDAQMSFILNSASASAGITVVDLSVSSEANVAQAGTGTDAGIIKPEDLVEEVRFNITLHGSYQSFLKFLDVLTKEDKVLKVRNFVIEKNSTNIDDDTIKFKGEVVGFKQSAKMIQSVQGAK